MLIRFKPLAFAVLLATFGTYFVIASPLGDVDSRGYNEGEREPWCRCSLCVDQGWLVLNSR
ncbi:hypothetical protein FKP32DRAFT_1587276 [Trametes sanguinea]|nr:hypothetical protein FKP32DRAFT_1587276 [Trametes sanguinea]